MKKARKQPEGKDVLPLGELISHLKPWRTEERGTTLSKG